MVDFDELMKCQEIHEETLRFDNPSFDTAVVGIDYWGRLIYDYNKMIVNVYIDGGEAWFYVGSEGFYVPGGGITYTFDISSITDKGITLGRFAIVFSYAFVVAFANLLKARIDGRQSV